MSHLRSVSRKEYIRNENLPAYAQADLQAYTQIKMGAIRAHEQLSLNKLEASVDEY